MKKAIALMLVVVIGISLSACGIKRKEVKLGETAENKNISKTTITDVQLSTKQYLKANAMEDDFLTPIEKDDLVAGDEFFKISRDDYGSVVITMIVENVGKNDYTVRPSHFTINYDNGNKYSATGCYAQVIKRGFPEWTELESVTLEKVTSSAVELKIVAYVPKVIIEDDSAPLTLDFGVYTYIIRQGVD